MTNLRTDERALARLKEAARPLTAEEKRNQRVSFVMSSLPIDSTITRDQVVSILAKQDGSKAA